jgi:F-type H+-transporting ATPase subunit delta
MTAGKEYAKALFMLSEEEGNTEGVLDDLLVASRAVLDNRAYLELLDTPALSKDEKLSLIDEAFVSLDKNLVSLIKILCEKRETRRLPKIAKSFEELYDESRGIVRVEAVSAVEMTPSQLDAIKKKFEAGSGKTILISNTVTPEILGGVKLRYEGIQLDGSVKTRLDKLAASLKSVIV